MTGWREEIRLQMGSERYQTPPKKERPKEPKRPKRDLPRKEEGKEVKLEWENGGNDEISEEEEEEEGRACLSGSRQESGQDLMTLSPFCNLQSPSMVSLTWRYLKGERFLPYTNTNIFFSNSNNAWIKRANCSSNSHGNIHVRLRQRAVCGGHHHVAFAACIAFREISFTGK